MKILPILISAFLFTANELSASASLFELKNCIGNKNCPIKQIKTEQIGEYIYAEVHINTLSDEISEGIKEFVFQIQDSKNSTAPPINCRISGTQPLCYAENLVLENCTFAEDADLCFEYSSVQAGIKGVVPSVRNPRSGRIVADGYGEIILDAHCKAPGNCSIETRNVQPGEAA